MIRPLLIVAAALAALPLAQSHAEAQTTLIASYSLNGTAVDATGNNGPMELINTPYEDGGIYSNGNYIGGDPDSSFASTPSIAALDFAAFSISVDFKIAEYPPFRRPVIIGSPNWRWGGGSLNPSGTLNILHNDTEGPEGTQIVSLDTWHTLVFTYDGVTGSLYLDNEFVVSKDYNIVHGDHRFICATNGGNGTTFKGHLRNLNVYNGVLEVVPVAARSWGEIKTLYP